MVEAYEMESYYEHGNEVSLLHSNRNQVPHNMLSLTLYNA